MPRPGPTRPALRPELVAAMELIPTDPLRAGALAHAFLTDNGDLPAAWRVAAIATRAIGDASAADRLDLEAIAAGSRRPGLAAAQKEFAADRLEEAEVLVRNYLRSEDPEDSGAALLLARIAARCGAYQQAENLARRALLLAPGYDEARMALALIQYDARDADAALTTLEALLARVPDHLRALALKAGIFVQLRRMTDADETFLQIHLYHPEDSRGWMNHAFMLKTIGRADDAIAAYRRAIATNPGNGQAWWGLANLKTVRFDEVDIAAMNAALAHEDISTEERLHFYFALGRALEGARRYKEAFANFATGANLRLMQTPNDPGKVRANVARAAQVFTSQFFAERRGWGCPAEDAIFIVSLPRSGSTLVEQILASHSAIEGTEELYDLERIALEIAPDQPHGYLDKIASLNRDEVRALGEAYLSSTARFRKSGKPRFTDKMPSNWVFAGLIRLILPNAKIIDIRRHPLDCGVALFTQHFNWGIDFSYDLDHIGQFYSAYVRQMSHFDRAAPQAIHHLTHEALVDDLEGEVRRMLDYLNLPFKPACLKFHETKRAVHTPSSEQVRRPINRDGQGRWCLYEPWLGPLKEALGAVLDHYPQPPPFDDQGN